MFYERKTRRELISQLKFIANKEIPGKWNSGIMK